jgi:hypothetical protein
MHAIKSIRQRVAQMVHFFDPRLMSSLWIAVTAAVKGGDLRPAVLGRYSDRHTTQKHRIKAVDRLLGNPRLQRALTSLYRAMAHILLRKAKICVIAVDWTQIDAKHKALTGGLPIGGRIIPLLNHVHACRHQPTLAMHRRFLKALHDVLPAGCLPILVTDAGFQGTWVAEVCARGWHYIARLRHRTCVRKPGETSWQPNKALHKQARMKPRDLGLWDVGRDRAKQRYTARLVLARKLPRGRHRKGRRGQRLRGGVTSRMTQRQREPWLLATNLDWGQDLIIATYSQRMQIEETFRDFKGSVFGFSLDATRSRDTARLEVLLLIGTLAFTAIVLVGLAAEHRGIHRELQANTERRRVLSVFAVGCLVFNTHTSFHPAAADMCTALKLLQGLIGR